MSAYDTVILNDHPVGYWKLNETSGTVAADSSGNGLNGTYVNSPVLNQTALAPGLGTCIDISANGAYVRVPHNPAFDFTSGAFTVEAWFHNLAPGGGIFQELVTKGVLTGYRQLIDASNGRIDFDVSGLQMGNPGFPIVANTSYHWVVVCDPSTPIIKYYLNGALVFSSNGGGSLTQPTDIASDLCIGILDFTSQHHFAGSVSNVAVYGTGLTATQVATHFSVGMNSNLYDTEILVDNPVGYWHLDGANVNAPVVDLSTNANNGAYLGPATYQNPRIAPGLSLSLGIPGDGQAQIPNISAYDFITGAWSVEFWIKPNSPGTGFQEPVTKGLTPGYGFLINNGSGEAQFFVGGVDQIPSGYDLVAGDVYHCVMTLDPGASHTVMYINGSIVAITAGGTLNPTDVGAPFVIGWLLGSGNKYDGLISNVALYATALSATRVATHYGAGIAVGAIPVPNVTGELAAQAEADLIAAGFVIGTVTSAASALPPTTVISQNPSTTAIPGSPIDLVIATSGLNYITGKFVPTYLSKAIVIGDASHINPRIYVPKRDKKIRVLP